MDAAFLGVFAARISNTLNKTWLSAQVFLIQFNYAFKGANGITMEFHQVANGMSDFPGQGVAARYAFMKQWRLYFPIKVMSRLFGVSRSGFYTWLKREPSRRAKEDELLKVAIKAAHKRTRESYSVRRLQPELAANGFIAGRDRIARLRRELGLRCRQKRKFKATTNSKHNLPVAENLLNQTFEPSAPNEVWVSDITYIPTGEGWLYLAGIKDVFTCEIVGYAMAERMTQKLTSRALFRAAQQKRPAAGLIHHSDRGSQYCSHDSKTP